MLHWLKVKVPLILCSNGMLWYNIKDSHKFQSIDLHEDQFWFIILWEWLALILNYRSLFKIFTYIMQMISNFYYLTHLSKTIMITLNSSTIPVHTLLSSISKSTHNLPSSSAISSLLTFCCTSDCMKPTTTLQRTHSVSLALMLFPLECRRFNFCHLTRSSISPLLVSLLYPSMTFCSNTFVCDVFLCSFTRGWEFLRMLLCFVKWSLRAAPDTVRLHCSNINGKR